MGGVLAAPAGWAGAGALGSLGLGESAAAAGTFLVSNPIGWAILGTTAIVGGAYLGYKVYQSAHSQSEAKFKEKTISQACSTRHDCNDLAKEIQNQQQEVDDRHQAMLDDQHGLYQAGPAGIPGKPYLGTWNGHQQKFEEKQGRLRKLLNAAQTAGCSVPNGNPWYSATKDPPSKPAGQ